MMPPPPQMLEPELTSRICTERRINLVVRTRLVWGDDGSVCWRLQLRERRVVHGWWCKWRARLWVCTIEHDPCQIRFPNIKE